MLQDTKGTIYTASVGEGRALIEDLGRPAPLGSIPWAFALNKTCAIAGVEISLLAFTVVGGAVRISGLVRLLRPDLLLSHVPDLAVSSLKGRGLTPIGAHVLPHGTVAWVSWIFERPEAMFVTYEGRIERVDLAYRAGGRSEVPSDGPWVFRFRVPCRVDSRRRLGVTADCIARRI
jgi:hypothetical protein